MSFKIDGIVWKCGKRPGSAGGSKNALKQTESYGNQTVYILIYMNNMKALKQTESYGNKTTRNAKKYAFVGFKIDGIVWKSTFSIQSMCPILALKQTESYGNLINMCI